MQELSIPSQSASPYTPVGGSNMPTAPNLGTPVPGTTGGLPALSGLSVFNNPLPQSLQNNDPQQAARQVQSYGRGDDTVLVHMTPNEVNSLRGLAQQFGGDLTINPHTGMPEAGWLGKLLPTILGIAGAAFGIPTWAIGLGVGAGQTAITGDLAKGLTAGLQAFGGAGLANAAGLGGEISKNAFGLIGEKAATSTATGAVGAAEGALRSGTESTLANIGKEVGNLSFPGTGLGGLGGGSAMGMGMGIPAQNIAGSAASVAGKSPGFLSKFAQETTIPGIGKMGATLGPALAGSAVLGGISDAMQPTMRKYEEEKRTPYEGPYRYPQRRVYPTVEGNGEIQFFDETNPIGYLTATGERRYAEGGEAKKEERPKFSYTGETEEARKNYLNQYENALAKLNINALDAPTKQVIEQQREWLMNPRAMGDSGLMAVGAEQLANVGSGYLNFLEGLSSRPAPVIKPPTSSIDMGGVTPGGGGGVSLSDRVLSPGATQSGPGLEVLKDTYTPKFTPKADYTSPYNAPLTLGSQMAAQLPSLTSRYQTSPGAVTALSGYAGGSPSERIRAMAQANAAAKAAASTTPSVGSTNEVDFGLADSANQFAGVNPYSIGSDDFWLNLARQYRSSGGTGARYADNPYMQERAAGGPVGMRDGAFVVDARTVSELGNGSSNAGIEFLSRLGGQPVRGPGDGVSDSVPARIGGKQKARVARDEVIFQPEAVRRIGGGSDKRGTAKLYALMDKAHKARKKAKRGQDTKLAKGLGALA